jgi:hypothetical protein
MQRVGWACLGIAAAAAAAFAAPTLAGAASPTPPRTALQRFVCHRASNSLNRWIEVTAVMRPITGTKHMEMKFRLLRKGPRRHTFVDVSSGDLGKWIRPTNPPTLGQRPGDVWSVRKPVVNLSAPATYRLKVTFQWLGSGTTPLATARQQTRDCAQ